MKRVGIIISILLAILFLVMITFCYKESKSPFLQSKDDVNTFEFAIAPHFLIGYSKVEDFYKLIYQKYWKKKNIVLISPNHFWVGDFFQNQTFCTDTKVSFDSQFIRVWALYGLAQLHCIETYLEKNKDFYITAEHWIWSHFEFINKYFSGSVVYPIILNPHDLLSMDKLRSVLSNHFSSEDTLFIASVDFSHHVREDFAYIHDKSTYYTLLNSTDVREYQEIEADCRSCLYLINTLAGQHNKYPHIYFRDSSSTIAWKDLGIDNTSRQFYFYEPQKIVDNGITLAFFWDLIYDRGVESYLDTQDKLKDRFKDFYYKWDSSYNLRSYYHRLLYGIDFVWLNLEMPAVRDKSICKPSQKVVSFCWNASILPYLYTLWFSVVNIANNHSMDGWIQAYKETLQNLRLAKLNYFGYINNQSQFVENSVFTSDVRGIQIAWHWYDFTTAGKDLDAYCTVLEQYKSQNYVNLVSVHWWSEYDQAHRESQQNVWEKLIDCWADAIIGHHPHVVQDVAYYKWKPIIYSLWNFLFDQDINEDTKKGIYVLLDINESWRIDLFTGAVNAYIK